MIYTNSTDILINTITQINIIYKFTLKEVDELRLLYNNKKPVYLLSKQNFLTFVVFIKSSNLNINKIIKNICYIINNKIKKFKY